MKAKSAKLANRHPNVVMIFEHEDDIMGAANILTAQVDSYRSIKMTNKTTNFLTTEKPSVILFALADISKCIEYYALLVEEEKLEYPHYSVLLCNNKESSLAFRCCMKGLFDNYFVYQPLYEKFRLVMIVQNGLSQVLCIGKMDKFSDENFDLIEDDLAELIDNASECKQNLLQTIVESQAKIMQPSTEQVLPPELSSQEVISTITQNHVKPLMELLENDIKSGLDEMISQLMNKQSNLKQQAQKAKDIAVNKTFNKPTSAKILEQIQSATHADESERTADTVNKDEEKIIAKQNKILVVDDNGLYRDMLVNVLKKENFEIDQAEDGLSALNKIRKGNFDLILMDLYMPKLDGLNTTKQIRQITGGKDIPIIALTGNKNKDIVRKWAAHGLKGYILKPSTKEEILACVGKVIKTQESASSAH